RPPGEPYSPRVWGPTLTSGSKRRLRGQDLDEAQPRAVTPRAAGQDELVGDRADDRDAETSLGEVFEVAELAVVRRVEALPLVVHLDDESVSVELVRDLDGAPTAGVRMPDRVRRGLRERELEV